MRPMLGILAICFAVSCGADGGGASPAERLDGLWLRDDALTACTRFLGFTASNGVAVVQMVCELNDGTLGAQIRVGTFEADSGSITINFEESSCPGESRAPDVLRYELDGSQLALGFADGLVVYERSRVSRDEGDDGLLGAAVTFGCFDEAGFFEPRAVQPI